MFGRNNRLDVDWLANVSFFEGLDRTELERVAAGETTLHEVQRVLGGEVTEGSEAEAPVAEGETLALLGESMGVETNARLLATRMALCLQGALLVRHSPGEVSDLFCASRLTGGMHGAFGMLTGGDQAYVVERNTPVVG